MRFHRFPSALAVVGVLVAALSVACSDPAGLDASFEQPGLFPVGNTTIFITDESGRTLPVELWYPADESARAIALAGVPVEDFVVDGSNRDTYVQLLSSAPAGCPSVQAHAARDSAPAESAESWPLLVFSHCHNCVRFSSFSIAERLASHGFVVAAPDHVDNTLFDDLAGTGAPLSQEFLQIRAADMSLVLDVLLDPSSADMVGVPAGLSGMLDSQRVGVYGHSFGAVPTGVVVQNDPRPLAGFAIASPMENPLLPGVRMSDIQKPLGFLVAAEDNSISELGNMFIRNNFRDANPPAWKGEVIDAGHWSFSNIAGLDEQFAAGCGEANRQTDDTMFSYIANDTGIAIAQAYVTAFFYAHVMGQTSALDYLDIARPEPWLSVARRVPE